MSRMPMRPASAICRSSCRIGDTTGPVPAAGDQIGEALARLRAQPTPRKAERRDRSEAAAQRSAGRRAQPRAPWLRLDAAALSALEDQRKPWQVEADRLRAERNANAKAVGMAKGRGEDVSALIARGEALTQELAAGGGAARARCRPSSSSGSSRCRTCCMSRSPTAATRAPTVEVRRWGEPRHFEFQAARSCGDRRGARAASTSRPPRAFPARASW